MVAAGDRTPIAPAALRGCLSKASDREDKADLSEKEACAHTQSALDDLPLGARAAQLCSEPSPSALLSRRPSQVGPMRQLFVHRAGLEGWEN
mmetsp:Transcript_87194/g.219533  ORF Transcript_87194/g.219533 Transcript_87194/m.219533 type:complete len:92 (+) Transcript_87194:108-383(+)